MLYSLFKQQCCSYNYIIKGLYRSANMEKPNSRHSITCCQ